MSQLYASCPATHFNPRPREEGDSFHCLYYNVPLYFNPRPREEGDLRVYRLRSKCQHFNPRPREEGDARNGTLV